VSTLLEILSKLQKDLNVPKGRTHNHKKYEYRNLEDILDVVKPLLPVGVVINCTVDIVNIGDRFYVKATAKIEMATPSGSEYRTASAYAREPDSDASRNQVQQITSSCSSYARRYALNGLLAISGHKDDDTEEYDTGNQDLPVQEIYPAHYHELIKAFEKADTLAGLKAMGKFTDQEKIKYHRTFSTDLKDWIAAIKDATASV
jgi:hypothetical protein